MTSNGTDLAMTSPSSPAACESVSVLSTSPQTVVIKGRRYRQRQLGPAPFASFEDLSDELDSPPDTARIPLPGITEDPSSQLQSPNTPLPQVTNVNLTDKEEQNLRDALTSSLDTPAPPRIDISRASSSSQHEDSLTSSPERENGTHNLGYKEDGAVDLRSSTEELDYIQEPGTVEESEEKKKRERMLRRQQQMRDFCDTQSQHELMERKDSNCSVISDVGLLCISGRTSRLSSIGSAASGGSVASGTSHLSVGSHLSGRSTRSPSPHKMMLETSFCGHKPMHSQNVEPETSPTLVSIIEKSASRPPSRLRSRSPSPHKMLLETSFCGTKQISPLGEIKSSNEPAAITPKKSKPKTIIFAAKIDFPKAAKQKLSLKSIEYTKSNQEKKNEKPKNLKVDKKRYENSIESVKKSKTGTLPKKSTSKPKKVISIRDIPGDEIYIPLKGPELDLEEIIRQTSPNASHKVGKPLQLSSDEIFIPLRSPTKEAESLNFDKNFEKEIYIPLHSPTNSSKETKKTLQKQENERSRKIKEEKLSKVKKESKKREYEDFEDGSIFIPLHSPEKEKCDSNFEEEIKKADEELLEAREAAEKRLKDVQKQSKPATLDLSNSGSHLSRLSQTYPSGKSEVPSGGSRTPSPGSSLSRKSSFASLFRKSDVFSSPDSQSGSTARKKSGTLSNILKEASDGLRERSRSRSKSRERQTQLPDSRSPSSKRNVFSNLFVKKKPEATASPGKERDEISPRLDLRFTFDSEKKSEKITDEGDYIIIPLKDPSDPPNDTLDTELHEEFLPWNKKENESERASSPLVILEKMESPKENRRSREIPHDFAEVKLQIDAESMLGNKKSEQNETVACYERRPEEIKKKTSPEYVKEIFEETRREFSEIPSSSTCRDDALGTDVKEKYKKEIRLESTEKLSSKSEKISDFLPELEESKKPASVVEEDKEINIKHLQQDSSLDLDEKDHKEEIVAVSADGISKLKLPPEPGDLNDDHERKGLVYQESFEDELPYIPTTLPLERSMGIQIVPVKHRVAEIKTCPIERPRSTTPINPTSLEDFVSYKESLPVSAEEKMKISLPRDDSVTSRAKSPRRYSAKGKTWFEFAEAGLQSPRDCRKSSLRTSPSPPPLPPRSSPPSVLSSSAPPTTTSWINFEELPEKRKLPKRITTVPTLRNSADGGPNPEKFNASLTGGVVYSYVSPEDCQCECHDHNIPHSKESDSKRGMKIKLNADPELNSIKDIIKNKTEAQKEKRKSECKECECGSCAESEDIEATPLLDTCSDGENEDTLPRNDEDCRERNLRLNT